MHQTIKSSDSPNFYLIMFTVIFLITWKISCPTMYVEYYVVEILLYSIIFLYLLKNAR